MGQVQRDRSRERSALPGVWHFRGRDGIDNAMLEEWGETIAGADMADWVTVAAYLVAAVLAARAAQHAWLRRMTADKVFWWISAVLLVLLGINELMDFQNLLTIVGRDYAKAHGWYEDHRRVQHAFVISLAAIAVLAGLAMLWLTRRARAPVRLALLGLVFIGVFVLFRAVSFHRFDVMLGQGPQRFNFGSMQEMAGILIVAAAALLYTRKRRRRP